MPSLTDEIKRLDQYLFRKNPRSLMVLASKFPSIISVFVRTAEESDDAETIYNFLKRHHNFSQNEEECSLNPESRACEIHVSFCRHAELEIHILTLQSLNSVISFSLKGESELPGYRKVSFNDEFINRYSEIYEEETKKKRKAQEDYGEERLRRRRLGDKAQKKLL